jgi:NTP pyrophosphatase (non-canonical NTP hydrolase)
MKKDLDLILNFRNQRDWKEFHSPKNLAIALSVEASELLEIFQWSTNNKIDKSRKAEMEDEIADIYYYLLLIAHESNIDIKSVFKKKMRTNEKKYPVDKSKGNSTKYNKL